MTKEEKIVLALSLIEQTKTDIESAAAALDKSLVTRIDANLTMVSDLITGKYDERKQAADASH